MLQQVATSHVHLKDYYGFLDEESVMELERLSTRLSGLKVAHLNATSMGGGVAEILRSLVPLMNGLGVQTDWYCINADTDFFQVTKNIHNSLQGGDWQFDGHAHDVFLGRNRRVAQEIEALDVDLWVVHDPQPCPVSAGLQSFRQAIWHCHLDSSTPNRAVWNYFQRYLVGYDRLVFCLPEYVNGSVPQERVRFIRPAIDPLTPKNQPLPVSEARQILAGLGIDPSRPLITQVARFDRWKDPLGVIDAYRLAKQEVPTLQLALVGVMEAQDDPEANVVFEQVQRHTGADLDIHLFSDPRHVQQREVNAFQTASTVVLQKSLREGFGLTVAEAMWKGSPVIGGNCGGIRVQIEDGHNGFLVATPEECARRIVQLIQDGEVRERIRANAKESVRKRYLMPRLLKDYLQLIEEVVLGG
ncbi:MAG: glycosyltransferase [Nitrospirae bacterium]|nr:glycosyltransferase [Nitrospirota bacterium]